MATQDLLVLFGYAFDFGYVAAGGGTRQMKAKTTALELDTSSRTYGGALGFDFGLMRGVDVFTDFSATMPLETKEAKQIPVTMGLAMSAQSGLRFDLTRKALDLALGVRYSSLAVSSSGAGGGETITAPFLSLQWGFDL